MFIVIQKCLLLNPPYLQKLFSPSRWDDLISQFRQENFSLYQLSSQSVLSVTLQAGLSALKTPYPLTCSHLHE